MCQLQTLLSYYKSLDKKNFHIKYSKLARIRKILGIIKLFVIFFLNFRQRSNSVQYDIRYFTV